MSRSIRSTVAFTLAAFALAALPLSAGAQSINLTGNETPTSPFGKGGSATYGQTFTAPTGGNFLQTFSFWLTTLDAVNPSSLSFQAFVMEWDAANGHASGPVLYTSGVQTGPASLSQRYDFAATNLALNSSSQYVAFLSASNQLSGILPNEAFSGMETSLLGTYTGGSFVFTDNGADFSLLSSAAWDFTGITDYQSHFEATFSGTAVSVVPEPSSLMLLISGLAAIVVVSVRRKRV